MAASTLTYGFTDLASLKTMRIEQVGIQETFERV